MAFLSFFEPFIRVCLDARARLMWIISVPLLNCVHCYISTSLALISVWKNHLIYKQSTILLTPILVWISHARRPSVPDNNFASSPCEKKSSSRVRQLILRALIPACVKQMDIHWWVVRHTMEKASEDCWGTETVLRHNGSNKQFSPQIKFISSST